MHLSRRSNFTTVFSGYIVYLLLKSINIYIYIYDEKPFLCKKVKKHGLYLHIISFGHSHNWITLSSHVSQGLKILRSYDVYGYTMHVGQIIYSICWPLIDICWTYFDNIDDATSYADDRDILRHLFTQEGVKFNSWIDVWRHEGIFSLLPNIKRSSHLNCSYICENRTLHSSEESSLMLLFKIKFLDHD